MLKKLFISLFIIWVSDSFAQNLVPNGDFTFTDTCVSDYGQIRFAKPWFTDFQSPDLFHACATNGVYLPPIDVNCKILTPYENDGFVGISTYGSINETMLVYLMHSPKKGEQIYCRMRVSTLGICDDFSNICYTNTIQMNVLDNAFKKTPILDAKKIIDNPGEWNTLQSCYIANGNESLIKIYNSKPDAEEMVQCGNPNSNFQFGYMYVDDVVFAIFDVIPSKIVLCKDEIFEVTNDFYNLEYSWKDGIKGNNRTFEKDGWYYLQAKVDDCFLLDSMYVTVIDLTPRTENVVLCKGQSVDLTVPDIGEITWSNGQSSPSINIKESNEYIAVIKTKCGDQSFTFDVQIEDCEFPIQSAPNVININSASNNIAVFYINPNLKSNGTFSIYDRYGSRVYKSQNQLMFEWDGKFQGKNLEQGVYVWLYQDMDKNLLQHGDLLLLK